MTNDSRVIKSFVWHEGKCFFVSTIERGSSIAADPGRYNETLVWRYDWDKSERGMEILAHESDAQGSIQAHLRVCEEFFDLGKASGE